MSDKPTIVVFSCFYEPYISGAERFVKEVVERLADRYDFVVVTSRLSKKHSKRETKRAGSATYKIRRIGLGLKLDKWLYLILAPFYAMKVHPKIVHAVMESYAGVALMLYNYIDGYARTVLTLQSGDLDSEKKQRKIPRWLWRRIHTRPNKITAISNFLRERAIRLGVDQENVSVIPNGFDLSSIPRAGKKIPHRVVCVARISWEKGIQYLVEAWPSVLARYSDAKLVLVGPEDNREVNVMKNIKDFIKTHNLAQSIEFRGALPHDETLKEISRSEVFVCPSLAEGLGIVFIEAQAVGVPVIGTNVGGIPDVIQNEKTGLLIHPRDAGAISRAVKKLFADKSLQEKVVSQAKENLHRFEWNTISKQVSGIYKSLGV